MLARPPEAGALVHADCPLVERGDVEDELRRAETLARELEAAAEELRPEAPARQIRSKAEPVLDGILPLLEVVEADELAVVANRVDPLRILDRVVGRGAV